MTYYVYMLRCFDGTFYVGVTNDVEKRFAQHCFDQSQDSFTSKRRPLSLVYVAEFDRIGAAIEWEKHVKRWSHRKKRALAENDWGTLKRYARKGAFTNREN